MINIVHQVCYHAKIQEQSIGVAMTAFVDLKQYLITSPSGNRSAVYFPLHHAHKTCIRAELSVCLEVVRRQSSSIFGRENNG